MPPLLCPSPLLLDHSFPRTPAELRKAAVALGVLHQTVDTDRACVAITGALRDFVDLFEWGEEVAEYPLLLEIYRFCSLLFLSGLGALVHITVDDPDAPRHPHPDDCTDGGLVDYWGDEVGGLLVAHEAVRKSQADFFMAVACAGRFSGLDQPEYTRAGAEPVFPLVGPNDLNELADAFEWSVPVDIADQEISFVEAYRNLSVIGCEAIERPSGGGSHYKARFPGNRPWVLDPNVDPVAERFIGQLPKITGLPTQVVKYALKRGQMPPRRLRLGAFSE